MARTRELGSFKGNLEYDDAYDEDVYGHSVEEYEYGTSPTMDQYMYSSRSRETNLGFGAYLPTDSDIVEEEEENDKTDSRARHDSATYEKPKLTDEEEVKLASVLDELRNILGGDQFSDSEMTKMVLANKFDLNDTLNALLNKEPDGGTSTAATTTAAVLPQRQQRQNRGNKGPSSAQVEKLTISGPAAAAAASSGVINSSVAANSIVTPVKAKVPVVVSSSATQDNGTPKVTRGFAVLQTEDCSTPSSNHLNAISQDSKRSRSNTPIRNKDKENKEVKEKENEKENKDAKEKEKETPSEPKLTTKIRDKEVDVVSEFTTYRKTGKELLNLVVVGHVDAGKSTLMGHLLYLKGNVAQRTMHKYEQESKKIGKQSFHFAWVLDETDEERFKQLCVNKANRMLGLIRIGFTCLDRDIFMNLYPVLIKDPEINKIVAQELDEAVVERSDELSSSGSSRQFIRPVRCLNVSGNTVIPHMEPDNVVIKWSSHRYTGTDNFSNFLARTPLRGADQTYRGVMCAGISAEIPNLVVAINAAVLVACAKLSVSILSAVVVTRVAKKAKSRAFGHTANAFCRTGKNVCWACHVNTGYAAANGRLKILLLTSGPCPAKMFVGGMGGGGGISEAGCPKECSSLMIKKISNKVKIQIGDF
ncbi:unnamed protein product, partial [Meganyctiphanes norvegica]